MQKSISFRFLIGILVLVVLMGCIYVMPVSAATESVNSFSGEGTKYFQTGNGTLTVTPSGSPGLWDRIGITISEANDVTSGMVLIYAPNGKCLNSDNPFVFSSSTGTTELTFWGLSKGEYTFKVSANASCRVTVEFNP